MIYFSRPYQNIPIKMSPYQNNHIKMSGWSTPFTKTRDSSHRVYCFMATFCVECKEIQDQLLSLTSVMFSYFPSTASGSHLNSSPPSQTPMVLAIPRKINSIWLLLSPPFFHHTYFFWGLCYSAYGILFSQPGIESGPPQQKHPLLTTGPPGNSHACLFFDK